MISKTRGAASQATGPLWALPLAKPRLVFARDDSSGSGINFGNEPRVLIVEDDFLIADDARAALIGAGFDVVGIAASAEEATRVVAAQWPALVIMDIRLNGRRDGIDLALELFRTHGLRSIFATAHMDAEVQKRAAPAQPLGWLPKPYTSASLVDLVQSVWNRRG